VKERERELCKIKRGREGGRERERETERKRERGGGEEEGCVALTLAREPPF